MTVSELIDHLQEMSPDAIVLTATDDEGNSYRDVSDLDYPCLIGDDYAWGEILTLSDFDTEQEIEEALDTMREAVILW